MSTLSMIMLTNTVNEEIFRMTQNALNTLHESIGHSNINVVLVESNKDREWHYEHVNFYLKPPIDFNYNTYLNIAIENYRKKHTYKKVNKGKKSTTRMKELN